MLGKAPSTSSGLPLASAAAADVAVDDGGDGVVVVEDAAVAPALQQTLVVAVGVTS